jgi:hypothetical protein
LIHREAFPFAAVLGQDDIKKALIWNIVNPKSRRSHQRRKGNSKIDACPGAGAVAAYPELSIFR